jgi:hypothetical protein
MNRAIMNQKTTSRCTQVIASKLVQGEQVEMVEAVQIGKVSAKRRVATTAAVTIATAGTVMIALKPQPFYVVITNQRIFFIENHRGIVGKIAAVVARDAVTAEPLQTHLLTLSMNVTIDGAPQRFSWGRAQSGLARRMAAALTALGKAPAL